MTSALSLLRNVWLGTDAPFLVTPEGSTRFADIEEATELDLSFVAAGEVVAIVGDFDPLSIRALLELIDRGAIVVPLTKETEVQHDYFFETVRPSVVIRGGDVTRMNSELRPAGPLRDFSEKNRAGLVLFTSGTTGQPKAILHDFSSFLERFQTPRPALITLSFLLFDHIGGINTLFHTLFNRGLVVSPLSRDVGTVLRTCNEHNVELLPTTPTFLRMLLMSDYVTGDFPSELRLITYGTERMDQPTLSRLCELLPDVEFRQTYGMSELGILRIKSRARDSLWMRVDGEGVETKIENDVLCIRSQNRMVGYLNAPDPFDIDGWYNTSDVVDQDGEWVRISGRTKDVINVGGLKFNASEVEDAALEFPGVSLAKAEPRDNPLTGQYVELTVQLTEGAQIELGELRKFLKDRLEKHKRPLRIRQAAVAVTARFKKK
jgi:acyl-coenzyme A synthetase/AMP-(fatty) acid ligase